MHTRSVGEGQCFMAKRWHGMFIRDIDMYRC